MSITINGSTNVITAASGLGITGNTAVTGTLSATGAISTTATGTALEVGYALTDAGTLINILKAGGAANKFGLAANGVPWLYGSTASGSTVLATQDTGATIATFSSTGLAVTGALSASSTLLVGTGSQLSSGVVSVGFVPGTSQGLVLKQSIDTSSPTPIMFLDSAGAVIGSVATSATTVGLSVGSGAATVSSTGLAVTGVVSTSGYTVATLPAGTVGQRAYVTDATAPTFLGALTGGGAVTCPVFYNGSAWVAG